MKENWVDFKAVKAAVSMEIILAHYKISGLRKNGDELVGRCPVHQGDGQRAFHVNLAKNAFHCFSCRARGNVLDFVAAMEKCSVRDAAIKIQEWYSISETEEVTAQAKHPATTVSAPSESRSEILVNKPLKFQLKGIDRGHPYLAARGISWQTAEQFGLGFFGGKGSMNGRIVIPIHNERGELVAYSGRAIDDSEPKYKLPSGFHKSLELYSLHRAIESKEKAVVIVEGFFGCLHIWQAGYPSVALMGSTMSEQQQALIYSHFDRAILLFDGDEAGQECMDGCLLRLGRKIWVKAVQLSKGKQPDGMTADELGSLLK